MSGCPLDIVLDATTLNPLPHSVVHAPSLPLQPNWYCWLAVFFVALPMPMACTQYIHTEIKKAFQGMIPLAVEERLAHK